MPERTDGGLDSGRRRGVASSDVFADRASLSPSFVPERLPERAAHRRALRESLTGSGPSAPTAAVIGRDGQGKSTTVEQVCDRIEPAAVSLSCEGGPSLRALSVRLHNALVAPADALARTGHSEARVCEAAREAIGPDPVVVVLDDAHAVDAGDLERFATSVIGDRAALVLVADSVQFRNALSRSFRNEYLDDVVVFGPYDEDELERILERRAATAFRPDTVRPAAIEAIAATGADRGGDARVAIDLLQLAGDAAVERGDTEVRAEHVEPARERYQSRAIRETVADLSDHERATLDAVGKLAEAGETPADAATIVEAYRERALSRELDPNTERSVRNYLETLQAADLLSRSMATAGRHEYDLTVDRAVLERFDE